MFKFILLLFTMLGMSVTFAQTTLNFQNPKQSTQPAGAPIPPSDFANQVKDLNTQKHTQFKQQLDQQKSDLSHPQIPSLSQVQSMSQTPPPPPASTESESTTKNSLTHINKLKPSSSTSLSSEGLPPPQATQESTISTTKPAPTESAPIPAKPSQTQPYTGFSPQSPPSQSGTAPKNSGGFNIQY